MVLPQQATGIWAAVLRAQGLIGCDDNIILSQGVGVHVKLHTMVDCDLQLALTCNLHNQMFNPLHQGCLTLLRQHLNWHMLLCHHVTPRHHSKLHNVCELCACVRACLGACVLGFCTFMHVCAMEEPASTAVITVTCVFSTSAHIAHHLCKVAARSPFSLVCMLLMFEHKSEAQSPISCHIRQERIASLGSLLALLDKTLHIRLSMQQVSKDQHKLKLVQMWQTNFWWCNG